MEIICEDERLPAISLSARASARARGGADTVHATLTKELGEIVEFLLTKSKSDQLGFGKRSDLLVPLELRLGRIRRQDFQIGTMPKIEEGIARAASRMRTAKLGAIAGKLLNIRNASHPDRGSPRSGGRD